MMSKRSSSPNCSKGSDSFQYTLKDMPNPRHARCPTNTWLGPRGCPSGSGPAVGGSTSRGWSAPGRPTSVPQKNTRPQPDNSIPKGWGETGDVNYLRLLCAEEAEKPTCACGVPAAGK